MNECYEVKCTKLKKMMFALNVKEIMQPCEAKGLCMALMLAEI